MFKFRTWNGVKFVYPDEYKGMKHLVEDNGTFYSWDNIRDFRRRGFPVCLSFCKKDINGLDVYIGDIVRTRYNYIHDPSVVVFDKLTQKYGILTKYGYSYRFHPVRGNLEIVGNVMENKELIPYDNLEKSYESFEWQPDPQYGLIRVKKK